MSETGTLLTFQEEVITFSCGRERKGVLHFTYTLLWVRRGMPSYVCVLTCVCVCVQRLGEQTNTYCRGMSHPRRDRQGQNPLTSHSQKQIHLVFQIQRNPEDTPKGFGKHFLTTYFLHYLFFPYHPTHTHTYTCTLPAGTELMLRIVPSRNMMEASGEMESTAP